MSGYDDAFASLSRFLEQLEGEGQLIASARSVYYEEEFRARASRPSAADARWEDIPVAICDWSEQEGGTYVDLLAKQKKLSTGQRADLETGLKEVFSGPDQPLARKPFFLTRTADLLLDGHEFAGGDDLLAHLVQGFLQRERENKLLDRQGAPLMGNDELDLVLCELALEMWNQETRVLDKLSVQEVAEYVLTTRDVPESTQQILLERVPSLASLVKSRDSRGLAFEHEALFFYFLTRAIVAQYFVERSDLRVVLGRSALPEDVANRIGEALWKDCGHKGDLQHRSDALGDAARQDWLRAAQVQQNSGLILLALIRSCAEAGHGVADLTVRSVTFPGGHLRGVTCRGCTFSEVTFRRTDLTSTRFLNCQANDLLMIEPRISSNTRLEIHGLDPSRHINGLHLVDGPGNLIYDPAEVAKIVAKRGGPKQLDRNGGLQVDESFSKLVEKLMRAYWRANPVCIADPRHKAVFTDRNWQVVRDLLLKHGIVTDEIRPTKGRTKHFLRRQFLPAEIMAGLSGGSLAPLSIQKFWRELAEETSH